MLINIVHAAHVVISVYAIGIEVIILTVFMIFVDFYKSQYAIRKDSQ